VLLTRLDPASRTRMARALRQGEPIDLDLHGPLPSDLRLDEVVPLCRHATARDPALARLIAHLRRPTRSPESSPETGAAITAVLPTHRRIPLGLAALRAQDLPVRVLILSNGAGPVRVPGAQVIRVPWRGHGATRQAALAHVQTPWVFFTVDDAIPLGPACLRRLVTALEHGPWEAVTARQLPWPDADPVTRQRLRVWTPAGRSVIAAPQADHVATLYRRDTLLRAPRPAGPVAEDAWWSRGRAVGYVPTAAVLHSHRRRPGALFRRNRDIHAELCAMGRPPTAGSLGAVARAVPGAARPVLRGQPAEGLNQLAELLGQWRGARRAQRRGSR